MTPDAIPFLGGAKEGHVVDYSCGFHVILRMECGRGNGEGRSAGPTGKECLAAPGPDAVKVKRHAGPHSANRLVKPVKTTKTYRLEFMTCLPL